MEKNTTVLPSDFIQKEFENNPLKVIESIRKLKDSEEKKKKIEEKEKNEKINQKIFLKDDKYYDKKINSINNNIIINNNIDYINNDKYSINIDNSNNENIIKNNNISKNNINNTINKISKFSKKIYLGDLINNRSNLFINNFLNSKLISKIEKDILNVNTSFEVFKYLLLNNINILLMYLNTHKGSILSQDFLDEIDKEDLSILFNNISPFICKIMCLEYGNYFIQKLIKKLSIEERLRIYQIIEPHFIEIATNKSGTHTIQSLIECANSSIELYALDKLLNINTLLLFLDENAYHIIMKIILEISENKRNNLNIFLVMNVEKIIINCYGAFCVNKFIYKNNDLQLRYLLIQNMQNNIQLLIRNEYSCSVLFLILEKFGVNYGLFIIKYIKNNFVLLSNHPISIFFIVKTLNYLYKNNIFELGILIWFIYKHNILIDYLLSNENGIKMLNQLINLSDEEQKNYIFLKMHNLHMIKDD